MKSSHRNIKDIQEKKQRTLHNAYLSVQTAICPSFLIVCIY